MSTHMKTDIRQSGDYTEPYSQQAIVEVAVRAWLSQENYLEAEDS